MISKYYYQLFHFSVLFIPCIRTTHGFYPALNITLLITIKYIPTLQLARVPEIGLGLMIVI